MNGRHPNTAQCTKGAERKWRRLTAEEMRASTERYFQAYGLPLKSVTTFKYLGQALTASNDDWLEVVGNLRTEKKKWAQLLRILVRVESNPQV